jgi:hypothetical protein
VDGLLLTTPRSSATGAASFLVSADLRLADNPTGPPPPRHSFVRWERRSFRALPPTARSHSSRRPAHPAMLSLSSNSEPHWAGNSSSPLKRRLARLAGLWQESWQKAGLRRRGLFSLLYPACDEPCGRT